MYIIPEVYRCLLHWEFAECWNHSILLMHLMPCQKKIFYLYKSACIQAVKKNLATRVEWCSMVDWMNSMLIVNLSQCTLYVESVEMFFEANDVGNWKHVSISLSNIGAYKRMGCCKARQPQKRKFQGTLEGLFWAWPVTYSPSSWREYRWLRSSRQAQVSSAIALIKSENTDQKSVLENGIW